MTPIRLNAYKNIIIIILLFVDSASAQSNNSGFYGNSKASGEVCAQNGSFMSESEVNNLVTEMLSLIGAKNRYVIVACPQLENCQATLFNGKPYILYNPDYLGRVKRLSFSSGNLPQVSEKDWETLTVLAHELGHHINNHILNPLPDATQRDRELEADESAGFIIYLMGGSITQASQVFSLVPEQGTYTHPGRAQRISALQKGWNDALKKYPKSPSSPNPVKTHEPGTPTNIITDDESIINSEQNNEINKNIIIKSTKTESDSWKILVNTITKYFDKIALADKVSGYIRTEWSINNFQSNTIRTRLIVLKRDDNSQISYNIKICSEESKKYQSDVSNDRLFVPWNRIMNDYRDLIYTLQTELK
jgi:hypothetical protein